MKQLKLMLTGAVLTLTLTLAMAVMFFVMSELAPVQADTVIVLTTAQERVEYIPLHDAPPQRDITQQRFAPLE